MIILFIVGANTGIGKETALRLAALGANTILLCKSKSRGDTASDEIRSKTGSTFVSCIQVDLASLDSIKNGVKVLKEKVDNIDILVNNAGINRDRHSNST